MLGQCASLAHLDLGENGIGDEGAGRLAAAVLSVQRALQSLSNGNVQGVSRLAKPALRVSV